MASTATLVERKKNEIVQEMLAKVRPYVGATGMLRAEADFDAFAALMAGERQFIQQTLMLTVLLSAAPGSEGAAQVYGKMAQSARLVAVLQDWLGDAVRDDSALIGKILELLSRLPLTVDMLVAHKLGKLVKRVAAAPDGAKAAAEHRAKAAELCDAWTQLARQEDARRRRADAASSAARPPSEDLAKTTALPLKDAAGKGSAAVVANLSLFSEPSAATAAAKSRAAQILERAARGETARAATRPLSADDIHKAKRRQQYLQDAATTRATAADEAPANREALLDEAAAAADARDDAPLPAEAPEEEAEPAPKRTKKRVSFASDVDLVKVHTYEPLADNETAEGGVHCKPRRSLGPNRA